MTKISLKSKSYLGLLITLFGLLVVMPFIEVGERLLDNLIVSTFFLLFLISSLKAISTRGITPEKIYIKWLLMTVALIAFLADITGAVLQALIQKEDVSGLRGQLSHSANAVSLFGYSLLIFFLVILIIKDLFSGQKVTADKIYGAVASYLLMGVMWACLYSAVVILDPGAIVKAGGAEMTSFTEIQYFSFTTLCSLGYGDIVPNNGLTMMLSNLEVIVGSLYLAILVARLVGLYTAQASRDKFSAAIQNIKNQHTENQDKE